MQMQFAINSHGMIAGFSLQWDEMSRGSETRQHNDNSSLNRSTLLQWAKRPLRIRTGRVFPHDISWVIKTCTAGETSLHASAGSRDSGAGMCRMDFGLKSKHPGYVDPKWGYPTVLPSRSIDCVHVDARINLTGCETNGSKTSPNWAVMPRRGSNVCEVFWSPFSRRLGISSTETGDFMK